MHPHQIAEADVTSALKARFQNENVKLLKWKVISLDEEEKLGHLGDHFRIETTIYRNRKDEDVSFFAKTIPMHKLQHDFVQATSMHRKEAIFYDKISKELTSILSKVRPMAPDSKVFVIPRCYLATDTTLIMEDLHQFNFKGMSGDQSLPLNFFLKSMQALARFHASSMVLEERLGKPLLTEYPDLDFETFLNASPDHYLATWHAASLHAASALVPMIEKYNDNPEVIKKTQEALPGLFKELTTSVRAWSGTRNVFCHGDLYTNNALFRLDDAGNPIEVFVTMGVVTKKAPHVDDQDEDIAVPLVYALLPHKSKISYASFVVLRAIKDELNLLGVPNVTPQRIVMDFGLATKNAAVEAVLVDYQWLRYAPPATDIITFLMFSTDKATRDEHFEEVVRVYHDELKITLHDLGYDVDKVLPWDELVRTLRDWKKCGLMFMMIDYPLLLAPSHLMDPIFEDDEKYYKHFYINRTPFTVKLFQEYEPFRSRYSEVCEELIDNYIL